MGASDERAPTVVGALAGRPWLTVAVLGSGLAVGLCVPALAQKDPVATAAVLVQPHPAQASSDTRRLLAAQATLARLPIVAQRTAARLPGYDVRQVEDRLRVVVEHKTSTLEFAFQATDPVTAGRGAAAAADAFLEFRRQQVQDQAETALRLVASAQAELAATVPSSRTRALQRELATVRATALVESAAPEPHMRVTGSPEIDDARISPVRAAAAGLLAGVFPALLLGHRAVRAPRRMLHLESATRLLGAAGVGELPWQPRGPQTSRGEDFMTHLELAAAALPVAPQGAPPRRLALVTPGTRRTSAGVVRSLATVVSRGTNVLLVTTAVRAFDAPPTLDVVRLGAVPEELSPWQLVLIDVPDLISGGSAPALLGLADSALILVPRRLQARALHRLRHVVESLEVPVWGVLLIDARRPRRKRRRRSLRRASTARAART